MKNRKQKILIFSLFFLTLCLVSNIVSGSSSIPDIQSVTQTPVEPPPNTVVNVVSVIVDRNGLENVSLFYSVNNSTWFSEIMLPIYGDNYNGTFLASIPPQLIGSYVSYYVYALDTFGYSTKSIAQNYTVTEDDTEPDIVEMWEDYPQIGTVTPWDRVRIRANITDFGTGVENVTLFYGFNEPYTETIQKQFLKVPMNFIGGDKFNGTYEGVIPSQENNTIVWYYVEAFDIANNKRASNYNRYNVRHNTRSYLEIDIRISEIDIKNLSAMLTVNFYAQLPSRYEHEFLRVQAINTESDSEFFKIQQYSRFFYFSSVTWKVDLFGNPNFFPYDHYYLNLTFQIFWDTIVDEMSIGHVDFSNYRLNNIWNNPEILNSERNHASEDPEVFAYFIIARNSNNRLPVILPIFGVFFLLGATLSVGVTKEHFKNRLTVYLSSFVFIVGFFYTLGSWVPLRFGFTIAELLVVALTLGTVALVVSSFISAALSTHPRRVGISILTDVLAVLFIFSLLLFFFTIPYAGALLFSIPFPNWLFIVIGLMYGLLLRLGISLKLVFMGADLKIRIRNFLKKLRIK